MAEPRATIGLIYQYNENWIGGTYYIQNLISALNKLDDELKPRLIVLCDIADQFVKLSELTQYPYLERRPLRNLSVLRRGLNRIWRILTGKNMLSPYFSYTDLDLVFPASSEEAFPPGQQFLHWIPDFQEHYLPAFFSEEELRNRRNWHAHIVEKGKYIVFSSHAAQADFNSIFPQNQLRQFVMQFAVTHPPHPEQIDRAALLLKYKLPSEYFICSNQFWTHKNQALVLKAVALLKQSGKKIHVAFTGKEHDFRNPDYFNDLQKLIHELNIEEAVSFLGFISREDQLGLMRHAQAIIQPSLFEGWSTVVEDGKAQGRPLVVSDLLVHREQLDTFEPKVFFDPADPASLALAVSEIESKRNGQWKNTGYDAAIKRYGYAFINIVKEING